jgi:phosphatidylinositol alpha 1,6-mannosyltransferase
LLPVMYFEAQLPNAFAHLLRDRQRYSLAARRSVLERSWPAICDELLGHYEAVLSPVARTRMRRQHAQGQ